MQIEQRLWRSTTGWTSNDTPLGGRARFVLALAGRERFEEPGWLDALRREYPAAHVVAASTAGEIQAGHVWDDSLAVTAVAFDHSTVTAASERLEAPEQSLECGRRLGRAVSVPGLRHVLVFSEGLHVNGSDLARGLRETVPEGVAVTGGLAGDGARMQSTRVGLDGPAEERLVVAVGLAGGHLRAGFGSLGGWDPFGPERLVTRSRGNVLYELDGQPALELYKRYLGDEASGLPASALLFPLALRAPDGAGVLVRTVLAVDEAQGTMTFAGDLPEGHWARLMKANFDRLIDGAQGAARGSRLSAPARGPVLALLVSCVGRKLILEQRVEEEVEAVRSVLGWNARLTGFYSYGEICPLLDAVRCELHNQTMTVTTIAED